MKISLNNVVSDFILRTFEQISKKDKVVIAVAAVAFTALSATLYKLGSLIKNRFFSHGKKENSQGKTPSIKNNPVEIVKEPEATEPQKSKSKSNGTEPVEIVEVPEITEPQKSKNKSNDTVPVEIVEVPEVTEPQKSKNKSNDAEPVEIKKESEDTAIVHSASDEKLTKSDVDPSLKIIEDLLGIKGLTYNELPGYPVQLSTKHRQPLVWELKETFTKGTTSDGRIFIVIRVKNVVDSGTKFIMLYRTEPKIIDSETGPKKDHPYSCWKDFNRGKVDGYPYFFNEDCPFTCPDSGEVVPSQEDNFNNLVKLITDGEATDCSKVAYKLY